MLWETMVIFGANTVIFGVFGGIWEENTVVFGKNGNGGGERKGKKLEHLF